MHRQLSILVFLSILLASVGSSVVVAWRMHNERRQVAQDLISDLHVDLRDRYRTFDVILREQERLLDARLEDVVPALDAELSLRAAPETVPVQELDELSTRYDSFDYIYIINADDVVVNTNFSEDLGLDLAPAGERMRLLLDRIRGSGRVLSDRFNASIVTGRLYKYAYYGPRGEDHIFEVGVDLRRYLQRTNENLDAYLFSSLFDLSERSNSHLIEFDVFVAKGDYAGWSVLEEGRSLPEEIDRRLQNSEQERLEIRDGSELVVYEQVPRVDSEAGETDWLVTRVSYDLSEQEPLFLLAMLAAVVWAVAFGSIAFLLARVFMQRWLLDPVSNIAEHLEDLAQGEFRPLPATGVPELDVITRGANTMVDEIADREKRLLQAQRDLEARVTERTLELSRANEELERMANTDMLTGLKSRRSFFELSEREVERARRHHVDLSLAMLDLDHFKAVNDRYGHPMGDRVLVLVSDILRAELRSIDLAGRVGGEEFGLLLPDTSLDQAFVVVERICRVVADSVVSSEPGALHVTISGGIAQFDRDVRSLQCLVGRADQALYRAKRSGRNRVIVAEPPSPD